MADAYPAPWPSRRDPPRFCRVYFIQCGRYVKIGLATNTADRLATLQTANPESLKLLREFAGGQELERDFHALFHAHRVRPNSEWFHLADEILSLLALPSGTMLPRPRRRRATIFARKGYYRTPKQREKHRAYMRNYNERTFEKRQAFYFEKTYGPPDRSNEEIRAELAARVARETG